MGFKRKKKKDYKQNETKNNWNKYNVLKDELFTSINSIVALKA